jgi:hypothetical protein
MGTSTRQPAQRRAALSSALHSERFAELCWWYLVCVAATSAAKLALLGSVYRHSDGFVLDEMAGGGASLPRLVLLVLVLARDLLQCALLAAGVFVLAAAFSPRNRSSVYRAAALLLALVILANHVAFMQLGTFASADVLSTAWGWVRLHPQSLRAYVTLNVGFVLLVSSAGIALPAALPYAARRNRALAKLQRQLPAFALASVLCGLVCAPIAALRFGERAFPVHGYWADVAGAAWAAQTATPLALAIPPESRLLSQYQKLAFYPPPAAAAQWLHPELEARRRPRHLLVVGLETAPRAFYPLTTAADLPTFARMTEHAIVSEHHYTTSPYTRIANFSMLSGLYAPPAGLPGRFGAIASDGFASVLRTRGYETSYVDSWVLDWLPGSGERAQAQQLGFDTVIDSAVRRDDGVFEVLQAAEQVAFDRAFARIAHAQEHGHKAAVFVGTMLGHSPWPAAQGQESLDGAARLHQIALVFDRLFAQLLERLAQHGLSEEIIILVVGDHGLRYADEFESLGRSYSHSDLSFNVPFLLYAPGLIDATLQLPYATSHIDISPTLLHLVGESIQGLLYDGGYVLDGRLANRVLYLSNSRLGPLDGLQYRGRHITYHALSGVAALGDGAEPRSLLPMTPQAARALPAGLRDPAGLLEAFAAHANLVAGRLLQRGAKQQRSGLISRSAAPSPRE